MAIAFDAAGPLTIVTSVDTVLSPHTCTGSDRLLRVGFLFIDALSTGGVLSAQYNGVNMTLVDSFQISTFEFMYLYELVNPDSGTNDIGFLVGNALGSLVVVSSSYTGAKQSGQPDASNKSNATSAGPANTSITTVADNSWGVTFVRNQSAVASAGTGSTFRSGDDSTVSLFDSNGALTPAGAHGLEVDFDGSCVWGQITASFSPVGGPPPAGGNRMGCFVAG